MILISGSMSLPEIPHDAELWFLIEQRVDEMADGDPFDPDLHGLIAMLEPGDGLADLEEVIGFDVLSDPLSGTRFGNDDFEPTFEVLEEHESCFELVIVPGDGDFGIVIFIPKVSGVDPQLLDFCQMYSNPAPSSPSGLSLPPSP
jgi:hypothetical protein